MTSKIMLIFAAAILLAVVLVINFVLMTGDLPLAEIATTLLHGEAETYEQSVLLYQQIPRSLIAIYVGATTAVSGCVLQGLARNPLASPSTLGLNAGATLFVVAGALVFDFSPEIQGLIALIGAGFGFGACFLVARLAGRSNDPRGLSLILSGALVSMLLIGITNALLLSNPTRRAEFLSWVGGNINHVYAERLTDFWWIGAIAMVMLWSVARPLTLVLLGAEKAASMRRQRHARFPDRTFRHNAGLWLGRGHLRSHRLRRPHRSAHGAAAGRGEFHAGFARFIPCRGESLRAGRSGRANPVQAVCGQYRTVHGPAWRPRLHRHRQALLSFAFGQ